MSRLEGDLQALSVGQAGYTQGSARHGALCTARVAAAVTPRPAKCYRVGNPRRPWKPLLWGQDSTQLHPEVTFTAPETEVLGHKRSRALTASTQVVLTRQETRRPNLPRMAGHHHRGPAGQEVRGQHHGAAAGLWPDCPRPAGVAARLPPAASLVWTPGGHCRALTLLIAGGSRAAPPPEPCARLLPASRGGEAASRSRWVLPVRPRPVPVPIPSSSPVAPRLLRRVSAAAASGMGLGTLGVVRGSFCEFEASKNRRRASCRRHACSPLCQAGLPSVAVLYLPY